jgi:hypothetical protein
MTPPINKFAAGHVVGFTALADQPTIAALGQTAGLKWSREEFPWHLIEQNPATQPGVYTWSQYDPIINNAVTYGYSILGLLAYTPQYYSSNSGAANYWIYATTSTAGLNAWSAYVTAVVNRYKDRVHVWQIWPIAEDIWFWQPQPGYSEYFALLSRAYTAIKAADPTATVLPIAADPTFLNALADRGGASYVDALSVHSYSNAPTGQVAPETSALMQLRINAIRDVSRRRYSSKPLWVTEYGWPTSTDTWGCTEDTQAAYMIRSLLLQGIESDIPFALWSDFQDQKTGATWDPANQLDNYGMLLRYGNTFPQKSSYNAFKAMTTSLAGASFVRHTPPKPTSVQVMDDFDANQTYLIYTADATGSATRTTATQKSGAQSMRIDYTLGTTVSTAVVLSPQPSNYLPVTGTPSRFKIWAKGDGGIGVMLVCNITDNTGETLGLVLGIVRDAVWREYVYDLDAPAGTSSLISGGGGDADLQIDFPIRWTSVSVQRWQEATQPGSGSIWLDDPRFESGSTIYEPLFQGASGNVLGVWSIAGTPAVSIATNASSATVRDWTNTTTTVNASGGNINVTAGAHPIFVSLDYDPPATAVTPATPTLVSPSSGATGVAAAPTTLTWSATANAGRYKVYLGTTNPPPFYTEVPATTTSLTAHLGWSTLHYWRIDAVPAVGSGAVVPSSVWSFTTSASTTGRTVTTLSPALVNRWAGSSSAVTIGGSGFGSTTAVTWNGPSPAPGVFVKGSASATSIPGTLTPHTNVHAGYYDVRVSNGTTPEATLRRALIVRAFTDVTESDWYFESSERMVTAGIMAQTGSAGSPTFSPTQIISRGDMAEYLVKGYFWMSEPTGVPTRSCLSYFPDVPCGHAQRLYIEWAKDLGITLGAADGNFYPTNNVTRAEMAAFLDRLAYSGDASVPKNDPDPGWADLATIPGWALPYVNRLRMDRVTAGCSASPLMFCALGAVQRSDISMFLARVVGEVPLP